MCVVTGVYIPPVRAGFTPIKYVEFGTTLLWNLCGPCKLNLKLHLNIA